MDKTLEIVMVAVALVVAVVIVTGILQGRANTFGGFADNQTSSSSCNLEASSLSLKVDCQACESNGYSDSSCTGSVPSGTGTTYTENNPSCWSSKEAAAKAACQ